MEEQEEQALRSFAESGIPPDMREMVMEDSEKLWGEKMKDAVKWDDMRPAYDVLLDFENIRERHDAKTDTLKKGDSDEEDDSDEEEELRKTLGPNTIPNDSKDWVDVEEELKLGNLTIEDGCKRDETGFVAPIQTELKGTPFKPKNVAELFGVTHFPAGTPIEEMNKSEPPAHLLECWQGAQDLFMKKWKNEQPEENDELREYRQQRRAKARRDIKERKRVAKLEKQAKDAKKDELP